LSILHGLVRRLCNEPNLALPSFLVNASPEPSASFYERALRGARDFIVLRGSAFMGWP
jgi:hypothetical protein